MVDFIAIFTCTVTCKSVLNWSLKATNPLPTLQKAICLSPLSHQLSTSVPRTKNGQTFMKILQQYNYIVNENPPNALTTQCTVTQYSATCFDTLKCYHQGLKHAPAEMGVQCSGKLITC
jgi:hypothetical protein